MDLSNSTVRTPEAESETSTRVQPTRPASSSNGVLKRHAPLHLHHHPVVVTYKECLKNFAAALGGHSLDGCGEFLPSPTSNSPNPHSVLCAVCGCHRNFHRRETEEFPRPAAPGSEYHSLNRHLPTAPPLPPGGHSSGSPRNSPSPPPISSSYYPSSPHMLMALSQASGRPGSDPNPNSPISVNPINPNSTPLFNSGGSSRKRHRTKFSQDQKVKMVEFAVKVGWKVQKRDEAVINEFCSGIGVEKGVLKVWMHNNKNTAGKKDHHHQQQSDNAIAISTPPPVAAGNSNGVNFGYHQDRGNGTVHFPENNVVGTNGSSSSS